MLQIIFYINRVIQQDLFTTFGIISILYPLGFLFPKRAQMKLLNRIFCSFTIRLGLVFLGLWIMVVMGALMTSEEPDSAAIINRMFGPYWFSFWLQPTLWIVATQLLRKPKFRYHPFLRPMIGLVLLVPLEIVMVLYTSNQREFVGIDFSLDPLTIAGAFLLKSNIFFCLTLLYYKTFEYVRRLKLQWKAETE